MKYLSLIILLLLQVNSAAAAAGKIEIKDLKWVDRNYLEHQVTSIDNLVRENFGAQLHANKNDLELLQRIIYKGLIPKDDTLKLQALGAVLGQVMAKEFNLQWKIYEDELGRSRALCAENSDHCLFPITMLSRRIEVGLVPDVMEIFTYSHEEIRPFLKKSPYDVGP